MRVNVAKGVYIVLGVVYVVLGILYLFNVDTTEITGFAVANGFDTPTRGLLGTGFLAFGIFLLFQSKRKRKKGQAALEFLMTYGWAILAAIIVIGVLAYFGVYSPGKFAPEAVVVNPPFYANAWSVVADDGGASKVSLEVRNNGGEKLTIKRIELANSESNGISGICDAGNDVNLVISAGELKTLSVNCILPLADGKTFKADVIITYTKSGSNLDIKSQGTVATRVAPGPGGGGPGCTDECTPSGTKECSGSGFRECGNYDADSCLEWSSATSCSAGETCSAGQCVPGTLTCPDGICAAGEECSSDSGACPVASVCQVASCTNGCVNSNLPDGSQPAGCDGFSQCVSGQCVTLVHHWNFENGPGDEIPAAQGGVDGSCSSCPTFIPGKVGNAANFVSTELDQINVGSAGDYVDGFSMTFWFKTNTVTSRIISRRPDSLNIQYDLYIKPSGGYLSFYDTSKVINSVPILASDGQWHFGAVVISADGTNSRMYLDGSSNYVQFNAGMSPVGGSTIIGYALGNYMNGMIDELRIYEGVLSPEFVQSIYDSEV